MAAENGSSEVWLRSCADTDVGAPVLSKYKVIHRDHLQSRRRVIPSIQLSLP